MIRKAMVMGVMLVLAGCAAKTPAPSRPVAVPIPAAPPRRPEPPAFNGISADTLKTRLGTPAFARKDGTTDMWRYDSNQCHVFFFMTGGKVSHIETVPRPADQDVDQGCLSGLKKTS